MNFTLPSANFTFKPLGDAGELISVANCKSFTATTQAMNKFYIIACVALFILWVVTAYKAGWLDKETETIRKFFSKL